MSKKPSTLLRKLRSLAGRQRSSPAIADLESLANRQLALASPEERPEALRLLVRLAHNRKYWPMVRGIRHAILAEASLPEMLDAAMALRDAALGPCCIALLQRTVCGAPEVMTRRFALSSEAIARVRQQIALLHGVRNGSKVLRLLEERVDLAQAEVGDLPTAREVFGWRGLHPAIRIPANVTVDARGLLEGTRLLTRTPMVVAGRYVDRENEEELLSILVQRGRTQFEVRVPRRLLANSRTLAGALSARGADVTEDNARDVAAFLSAVDSETAEAMPETLMVDTLGWQLDGRFQLGHTTVCGREPGEAETRAPVLVRPDAGMDPFCNGFSAGGSWEGWLNEVYEPMRDHPALLTALYGVLAAPMVHLLDAVDTFTIELAGASSRGKSTALLVAGSAFGRPGPGGVVQHFNATVVHAERITTFMCDCPLIIDETKQARSMEMVVKLVYDLVSGATRGRGRKTGGVERTRPIRTVMLFSGESSVLNTAKDHGLRARVLSYDRPPLDVPAEEGRPLAEHLKTAALRHHGHLGPRFLHALIADDALREGLNDRLAVLHADWAAGLGPVGGRLARCVAVLQLVEQVLESHVGLPAPRVAPWPTLRELLQRADHTEDVHKAALESALQWLAAEPGRFALEAAHSEQVRAPLNGWLGVVGFGTEPVIYFHPSSMRERLARAGYRDFDTHLKEWNRRGWLQTEKGRLQYSKTVGGVRSRYYAVTWKAQQELGLGMAL